jgi:hypothetical protein
MQKKEAGKTIVSKLLNQDAGGFHEDLVAVGVKDLTP